MTRGVRWYLVGSLVLVALAGCGRGFLQYAEREPWRREAETACIKSGTVREKPGLVRIEPIEGPGICGADFPLKVAALGDNQALGFAGEPLRPPGSIPQSAPAPQPRWPIAEPRYAAPPPPRTTLANPGAQYAAPPRTGAPLSLEPPGLEPKVSPPQTFYPQQPLRYGTPPAYPQANPNYSSVPRGAPPPDEDDEEELERMPQRAPARTAPPIPALGPARAPRVTGSVTPVEVKPTATLACPIVSALDHWIAEAVQPAAQRWFNQPVVELKQISAYSCRGMNGQVGARISEHAFGNALDIAAFVLADGRRITVKDGWQGSPEEQGFLRDVQSAACDTFTTVLAPGSNHFHYDHIHVDLMRRASGRRICQPGAVDGELVAARAKRDPMLAMRRDNAPPTRRAEPFDSRNDPFAWRGADARRGDPMPTGSVSARKPPRHYTPDEDDDWIEDEGPRIPIE
jgi:hypothetical protein